MLKLCPYYHIAGDLVRMLIWQVGSLGKNKILPIFKLPWPWPASYPSNVLHQYFTKAYLHTPPRMQCQGFLSGRKYVLLMRVWGVLWGKQTMPLHAPKLVLPQNQVKCNERTRGEDKDGKVCHRKQPSQLLYTSLSLQVASYHEVCIIVVTSFFGEERNSIKSSPNSKYIILAEFANLIMPVPIKFQNVVTWQQ